jgi:hypothetical protein
VTVGVGVALCPAVGVGVKVAVGVGVAFGLHLPFPLSILKSWHEYKFGKQQLSPLWFIWHSAFSCLQSLLCALLGGALKKNKHHVKTTINIKPKKYSFFILMIPKGYSVMSKNYKNNSYYNFKPIWFAVNSCCD